MKATLISKYGVQTFDLTNQQKETFEAERPQITIAGAITKKRADINIERSKRLAEGFTYQFPDSPGTVVIREDKPDQLNITVIGTNALGLISIGSTEPALLYIDDNDVNHYMTGEQGLAFSIVAGAFGRDVYAAASAHKTKYASDNPETGLPWTVAEIEADDITTGWPE